MASKSSDGDRNSQLNVARTLLSNYLTIAQKFDRLLNANIVVRLNKYAADCTVKWRQYFTRIFTLKTNGTYYPTHGRLLLRTLSSPMNCHTYLMRHLLMTIGDQ